MSGRSCGTGTPRNPGAVTAIAASPSVWHDAGAGGLTRRRRAAFYIRILLLVIGAAMIPFQAWWLADGIRRPGPDHVDSPLLWHQVQKIQRHVVPLYREMPGFGPDVAGAPPAPGYPVDNAAWLPPLASLVSLLPPSSLVTFQRFWFVAITLAYWAYAALLGRLAGGRWTAEGFFVWHGALVLVPGSLLFLVTYNVDPLLWVLFGAALTFPAFRGTGLVLQTAVKPYAVWALAVAAFKDGRRVVVQGLCGGTAAVVVCVLAMGPVRLVEVCVEWFRVIPPALAQGGFIATNWSLSFLPLRVARWAGWWTYEGGPLGPGWRLWLAAASLMGPLVAWRLTRRWDARLHVSAVMLAALLFSPLCWQGYLAVSLVPVAVLVRRRAQGSPGAGARGRGAAFVDAGSGAAVVAGR